MWQEQDKIYNEIIADLKLGKRPMKLFTEEQLQSFLEWGDTSYRSKDTEGLKRCLCVLDHCQKSYGLYTEFLISILENSPSDEITIYALGTSSKHIVSHYGVKGEKTPAPYRLALVELLKSHNPELIEWVLRIIEQLGTQTMMFVEPVTAIRPSFWKTLPGPLGNEHARNCRDIIKILESRWRIFR